MKNKIEDLRNHLFAQLERLNDESLQDLGTIEFDREIQRSKVIATLAKQINDSAKTEVQYLKFAGSSDALDIYSDFIPKNRKELKQ